MKIKGIIFDLDGVICHTDAYHYAAWQYIAQKLCIDFSRQDNNRLRGVSRMESLNILLEKYPDKLSQKEREELAEEKNELYRKMLLKMTPQDVGEPVRQVLCDLRKQGYLLAIGSSSKNAQLILERTQCDHYFDAVCDGNHISHSKPHPEVFEKAAQKIGLQTTQCVVVEDAASGVEAALKAGCTTVAIGSNAGGGAHYFIDTLAELFQVLKVTQERT